MTWNKGPNTWNDFLPTKRQRQYHQDRGDGKDRREPAYDRPVHDVVCSVQELWRVDYDRVREYARSTSRRCAAEGGQPRRKRQWLRDWRLVVLFYESRVISYGVHQTSNSRSSFPGRPQSATGPFSSTTCTPFTQTPCRPSAGVSMRLAPAGRSDTRRFSPRPTVAGSNRIMSAHP